LGNEDGAENIVERTLTRLFSIQERMEFFQAVAGEQVVKMA
jgi:hypothetical protein